MIIEILIFLITIIFSWIIASILILIAPEEMKSFNKYFWMFFIPCLVLFIFLLTFINRSFLSFIFSLMIILILLFTQIAIAHHKKFLFQERTKIDYITSEEFVGYLLKKNKNKQDKNKKPLNKIKQKEKIKKKDYLLALFKLFPF